MGSHAHASVLVGLMVSAFVRFECVRIGLLDPTRIRRMQRIQLVEIVRLACLLVRRNYIYGRRVANPSTSLEPTPLILRVPDPSRSWFMRRVGV
jgi:hypothetical protein